MTDEYRLGNLVIYDYANIAATDPLGVEDVSAFRPVGDLDDVVVTFDEQSGRLQAESLLDGRQRTATAIKMPIQSGLNSPLIVFRCRDDEVGDEVSWFFITQQDEESARLRAAHRTFLYPAAS